VIEFEEQPALRNPLLLCAFEGWNDAAGGATGVIDHLLEVWNAELIGAVDPEEFYDFQVNRPMVTTNDDGMRGIVWPTTQVYVATPTNSHRDVVLVRGIEPNMRWRQFCAELLAAADELDVTTVCTLGAMLAEVPHTRPIQVSGSATELDVHDRLRLEPSHYEGPTGIMGVLQDACVRLDVPAVSFWAAVPHYLPQPPCPKATLALLTQVEDLLEINIPLHDLPEDARAWERGVAELVEDDEDLAEYIDSLAESSDTADLPEASGEAIAKEFERYLKRREEPGGS
jgi:predicted ATP-grasp superfamily ATP-dependent carboligase